MSLRGQLDQRGYAMAALLVMLAVMSILMTALLPAWRFQAKREKELELIFRGEQYVKAIERYERKMGPGMRPPSIDVLVQQRFLRKKYKDPMTEDGEFQPIYIGANNPTSPTPGGRGQRGLPGPTQPTPGQPSVGSGFSGGQPGMGGILGVVSKSKESSIRTYKGGTRYNEWRFIFAGAANRPGMPPDGGRGTPGIGGRGQRRPGMPGERGRGGRGFPGMPGRGQMPGGRGGSASIIRGPGQ
jgi:type II secretory pathway pseudopilin PulG